MRFGRAGRGSLPKKLVKLRHKGVGVGVGLGVS